MKDDTEAEETHVEYPAMECHNSAVTKNVMTGETTVCTELNHGAWTCTVDFDNWK